jgi:hypothetical protein
LTRDEVLTLTRELSAGYDVSGRPAEILLILSDEIVSHCREPLHVEMVAFTFRDALFSETDECRDFRASFVEQLRSELKGGAR